MRPPLLLALVLPHQPQRFRQVQSRACRKPLRPGWHFVKSTRYCSLLLLRLSKDRQVPSSVGVMPVHKLPLRVV